MPKKAKKTAKKGKKGKSKNVQNPYFKNEAKLYALWRSIPHALHSVYYKPMGISKIKDIGFDMDDDVFIKLLEIRTKTEFSKSFKVSMKQLKRWDESEKVQKWVEEYNKQSNILRFKKDVDFHFTQKTIKEGDAARVKLWKQLYEDWREKSEIDVNADEIKEIAKAIKKIAER